MPTAVVLPRPVTYDVVERLFVRAKSMAAEAWRHQSSAEAGCRAVKAKDPRVLTALERSVEVLSRAYETQLGETQRRSGLGAGERVKPEVLTFFEKALVLADKGPAAGQSQYEWERELVGFGYVYAAVAEYAGAFG